MMECPRCGFVQPEDRFCANCGLNIATYRAKPKPLNQRLLASPIFYLAAAVVAFAAIAAWIKRAGLGTADPRAGMAVENSQPVANATGRLTTTNREEPSQQTSDNPPPAYQVAGVSESPSSEATTSTINAPPPATAPAPGSGAIAGSGSASKQPSQYEIAFYEISRESWASMAAELKTVGEQSGWRIASTGARERLTTALAGARRLTGGRTLNAQASSAISLHFPVAPTEPPVGLFLDVSVIKNDGSSAELELAGQLALKHDGGTETNQRAEMVFSFPAGGAIVISGYLPRRPLPESQAAAALASPLAPLESADFLEGQSESILVISGR